MAVFKAAIPKHVRDDMAYDYHRYKNKSHPDRPHKSMGSLLKHYGLSKHKDVFLLHIGQSKNSKSSQKNSGAKALARVKKEVSAHKKEAGKKKRAAKEKAERKKTPGTALEAHKKKMRGVSEEARRLKARAREKGHKVYSQERWHHGRQEWVARGYTK